MAKNKIEDLRNLLFETMERLLDEDNPMDANQAQIIANVAKVIVESAKVEVQFMKQVGITDSSFIPNKDSVNKIEAPKTESKQLPIANIQDAANRCITHAAKFGHSKKEAEECDNFSVGCLYCPLKDKPLKEIHS